MAKDTIVLPPQPTGSEKVHVRTDTSKRANTIATAQTSVGTTATKITTPADAKNFILKHTEPVTVWLGGNDSVTAGGSTAWPLEAGDTLILDQFQLDNDNSIYGIVDSGTVTVYCLGKVQE